MDLVGTAWGGESVTATRVTAGVAPAQRVRGPDPLAGGVVRQTKLLRPRLARDAVDRPRLLAALDRGLDAPLVLLSGPAGYGKTTLLLQWLAARSRPAAWLTLDDRDDAASFAAHVAVALGPHLPDVKWTTLGLLRLPGTVAPADLGAALAEDLAAASGEAILVLDDYQEVAGPGVHDLLVALLRHPPRSLHLVLATRLDPPLPLARLRARGQLVELRSPALRFTPAEAAAYLAGALPAPPPTETVAALAARTEGWAAGLRLAAVAMQGQDPSGEVAAFTGRRQAAVMEYLLAEAFERQSETLRDFLLRTAVAERLCAPLCGALLATGPAPPGVPDGSPRSPAGGAAGADERTGEALLGAVLRANLSLSPLDGPDPAPPVARDGPTGGGAGGVTWYRYHPLFRDELLHRLRTLRGPGAERALHGRAGAWFAAAGMLEEGLHHLLAAGDVAGAAALVERYVHPLLEAEEWPALERWLAVLPPAAVERRPALLVARAMVAQRRGRLDALGALLAAARAALGDPPAGRPGPEAPERAGGAGDRERATLQGLIAGLTGFRRLVDGDAEGALAAARRALALLPEACHYCRGEVIAFGAMTALAVDGEDAVARWLRALPVPSADGADVTVASALPGVGVTQILAGRHHDAAAAGRTLLRLGTAPGRANARRWGLVLLGAVEYEWNDLAAATEHLTAALEAPDQLRLMPLRVGSFALALALQAQGRAGAADDVLDRLSDALLRTANAGELARVRAFRVRLALRRGELAPARSWLPSSGDLPAHWLDTVLDSPPLTRAWARLCLAPEAPSPAAERAAALADLDALLAVTERLHLVTRQAQVRALRALALDASGEAEPALDALAGALDLGEPGGLVRTFADLGPPLADLLRRLAARRPRWAYLARVLTAGEAGRPGGAAPPPGPPAVLPGPAGGLAEPLTQRELEVLDRLRRQWYNKEIAADLHVSPETVKRHAANIYAKLGVGGRREAVRRAAELGLLPLA
jgi:LuxR family maltose regulon positive regulatory protein